MQPTTRNFPAAAKGALADVRLARALTNLKAGFQQKRADAVAAVPEWEELRVEGERIKNHILENLDVYLEIFTERVAAAGGHVHFAPTAGEARDTILKICRDADARTVTKGKTMVGEEIGLNPCLEAHGITPIETDLGEYIVQLRGEVPSHIIAPAIHLSRDDVARTFREQHSHLPADRQLEEVRDFTDEARGILRRHYQAADVGITGANFLVAETGSTVIVTNEGNGDLTQCLPRTHVVITSIEKLVPNLEDVSTLLRLLPRSATGQEFSAYATFSTGPRRPGDADGPEAFHVVILDNGRSGLLATPARDALRCIRCSACINHCPIFAAVGGHAYGWVLPGPIGAAMTPGLIGLEEAHHLPHASTFCGRCAEVCPMRIPLPRIMHYWREQSFERGIVAARTRAAVRLWAWLARRPRLYRSLTGLSAGLLGRLGRGRGRLGRLPLAGGWTAHRDLPAPQGGTFMAQWARREGRR